MAKVIVDDTKLIIDKSNPKSMEEIGGIIAPSKVKTGKSVYFGGRKLEGTKSRLQTNTASQKELEIRKLEIEKYNSLLQSYNSDINLIDRDYSEGNTWGHKLIVRCFHLKDIEKKVGDRIMILPKEVPMLVETNNGIGVHSETTSPWKLSTKAIVICVPPNSDLKVGSIIQIDAGCVAPKKSIHSAPRLPMGYTKSEHGNSIMPPTSCTDVDFGYLLINGQDIIKVIKTI